MVLGEAAGEVSVKRLGCWLGRLLQYRCSLGDGKNLSFLGHVALCDTMNVRSEAGASHTVLRDNQCDVQICRDTLCAGVVVGKPYVQGVP